MSQKGSMNEHSKKTDAVSFVNEMLHEASFALASDIHFEPQSAEMTVRYRLDGILNDIESIPDKFGQAVVTRLMVMAGLLTYRTDIPQEGAVDVSGIGAPSVRDCRVAIFPTVNGLRAVVRMFYDDPQLSELDNLGFEPQLLAKIKSISQSNQGIVLFTGPAGSGKSTTMGAILRHINKETPGKSIVTLEDPVERKIDGVTQVQISPHGEMTFAVALRSLLRQDPQVLMIGEIRDAQTAGICVQAGLTGHLLMSTLHSGSPSAAIMRLLEMGIEPYQLTSSLRAVVNQRLLRKTCKDCAGKGCKSCFGTGYKGRVLIAEMVELDGELRTCLLDNPNIDSLNEILVRRGHMTLVQHGNRLVEQNITTAGELQRITK